MATPTFDDLTVVTDGSCVVCSVSASKEQVVRAELDGADGTHYRDLCSGCLQLVVDELEAAAPRPSTRLHDQHDEAVVL